MALKIKVFGKSDNPAIDLPFYHIGKAQAVELLQNKQAILVGKHALQLTKTTRVKRNEYKGYELAAIYANPQIVNAGRMSGERQPAKIDPFKSCRIGH